MALDERIQHSLHVLARQYFQLLEPGEISWPTGEILKDWNVQSWLYENLFNANQVKFAPPARYQLRVLKRLVTSIEKSISDPEEDEISDDLMSLLSQLMGSSLPEEADAAQEKAYVTYSFDEHLVTLLESRAVISGSGTTGLRTWEAALHLGKFLMTAQGKAFVYERTMLELGAGTGLISILCGRHLGAKRVLATDGVEIVVDAIKTNMFLNDLEEAKVVESAALKWGRSLLEKSIEDYAVKDLDVVVGADVTYDKSVIPALVSTLWQLFELRPNLQVLIAATIRNESTFEAFVTACRKRRFNTQDIDFGPPAGERQTGPFYSTAVPLRIVQIQRPTEDVEV